MFKGLFSASQIETIKVMHHNGKSPAEIAEAMGCFKKQVYNKIHNMKRLGQLKLSRIERIKLIQPKPDEGQALSASATVVTSNGGQMDETLLVTIQQISLLKHMTPQARIQAIKLII